MDRAEVQAKSPQLAHALDAELMRAVFEERMWAGSTGSRRYSVNHCVLEHARLRPGKCTVVGYRLLIADDAGRRPEEVRIAARIYPTGDSLRHFLKARINARAAKPPCPPLFHVPQLGMVAWTLPNERKLGSLAIFASESRLRSEVFPRLAGQLGLQPHAFDDAAIKIVHYVPEHGCTVRVEGAGLTIYGKHYLPGAAADAHRILVALWNSETRRAGGLRVPQPIFYLPEQDVVWRDGLSGRTLLACFVVDAVDAHRWQQAAVTLHALHRTPVNDLPGLAPAQMLERLQRTRALVHALAPDCLTQIEHIVGRLVHTADAIDFATQVTLHGDLHPDNILLDPAGVGLLDLDSLSHGPAAIDIGSFAAAMIYQTLRLGRDMQKTRYSLDLFFESYRQCATSSISDSELAWGTAFALVAERVYRCMTRLKAGRSGLIAELLHHAQASIDALDECASSARHHA